MKKILFIVAILATAFWQQTSAQPVPIHREDSNQQTQFSELLHSYYDIKNALVAGNSAMASLKADDFIKHLNAIDAKVISTDNSTALLKDATHISEGKEIKHQREHFAKFSENMFTVAKAVKLTSEPIYQAYCPMKKASWLSSEKAIKNPYFGSAMLTCGSVKETLK